MPTLNKLALLGSLVALLFAIRAISRLVSAENEHQQHEQAFSQALEESKARQAEAGAAGNGRDTQACIEWSMESCPRGGGEPCNACSDALRGCLSTAQKNESFCAAVPAFDATVRTPSDAWRKAQVAKYDLSSHFSCAAMFKFVELHCHPPS